VRVFFKIDREEKDAQALAPQQGVNRQLVLMDMGDLIRCEGSGKVCMVASRCR
jgi:hypothetical protein